MVFNRDPLGIASSVCVYILLVFGDYAIVYYVLEYGKHEGLSRSFGALLCHFLAIMAVISHIRAAVSDPGYVPLSKTKIDFSSDLEKADPNQKKKKKKKEPPPIFEWTVCTRCEIYRPPRSHHCRKCGRCVRRMDHHCPWINNCVGELNFKYFFLFVVYGGFLCLYGFVLISVEWFWHQDKSQDSTDKVITTIAFFEAVIFGLFILVVGSGQVMAILCDRNAIEIKRYGHPMGFPKTPKMALIQAVCGRGPRILWLFPCVRSRIPDPVPPSKLSNTLFNGMIQSV